METAPNNLSEHELSIARWLVYHKNGVRTISLGILIGAIALTWGYFFFALVRSDLIGYSARTQLLRLVTAPTVPLADEASNAPQELVVSPPAEVGSGTTSGSLTMVENPNTDWVARISYSIAGSKTTQSISIAPKDTAYLYTAANETPQIDTNTISWQHLDRQAVPDIEAYKKARHNFVVKDAKYQSELSKDKKTVNHVTFTITNASSWSYWEVPCLVLLYQGNRIGGVSHILFSQFKSGESRNGDVVITQNIGGVSSIEIIPQVDAFEPSSFMPLEKAPRLEIGT